jgi:mRNA-degrading endonuclease HigB of HigAB toxin-antitoxin module
MLKERKPKETVVEPPKVVEAPIDLSPLTAKIEQLNKELLALTSTIKTDIGVLVDKLTTTQISGSNIKELSEGLHQINKLFIIFGESHKEFKSLAGSLSVTNKNILDNLVALNIKDTKVDNTDIVTTLKAGQKQLIEALAELKQGKQQEWVFNVIKDNNGIQKVIAKAI